MAEFAGMFVYWSMPRNASGHDLRIRDAAGQADVVEDVRQGHDERADDKRNRQVAPGILELSVDARGDDPALVCKGRCRHGGEQRVAVAALDGCDDGGEVFDRCAVGKADDRADDAHEQQRDELDDRGRHLKLARQDRRQGVDRVAADEEQARKDHDRAARDVKPAQHAKIPCADPGQHGRHGREIDKRCEPAHVIGVALAHERLGVVYESVDVRITCGEDGEHVRADDHDQAADRPGEDAERQVAAGRGEDLLGFEEHAAADDDADDECDRRRQAILFLQFIVHKSFSSFPQIFCHQFHA